MRPVGPLFKALEEKRARRAAARPRRPVVLDVERVGREGLYRKGALVVLDPAEARGHMAGPETLRLESPYLRGQVYPRLGGRLGRLEAAAGGRALVRFEVRLEPGEGTLDLGGALDDFGTVPEPALREARFAARRGFVLAAREGSGRRLALLARRAGTERRSLAARLEVNGALKAVPLERREVAGLGPLFVGGLDLLPGARFRLVEAP